MQTESSREEIRPRASIVFRLVVRLEWQVLRRLRQRKANVQAVSVLEIATALRYRRR